MPSRNVFMCPKVHLTRIGDAFAFDKFADLVDTFSRVRKRFANALGFVRIDHDHHADAAVEGPKHFLSANIAEAVEPFEHRQNRPSEIHLRAKTIRQHSRDILGKAATGDMRQSFDLSISENRQEALHVDACRGEERLANGFAAAKGSARLIIEAIVGN